MSGWPPHARAFGLWLLAGALAGLAWMLPPIAQPPAYHAFADQRACWGLPNCLDTVSNALFVLAGALGLRFVQRGQGAWRDRREAWPYGLFFLAMILVGLASGYYHLAPDNARLLGDRLAMMLAFMAWFSAIVCERVGPVAGLRLLPLAVAAGLGSAAWWGWSEARGMGDLRFYFLMQLYPVLLVPLLLRLYPPRYSGDRSHPGGRRAVSAGPAFRPGRSPGIRADRRPRQRTHDQARGCRAGGGRGAAAPATRSAL